MFITRFTSTDKDKIAEDYLYHTGQKAPGHLLLFKDDVSGLYRNIAIIDDRNYVPHILPFADGKPQDVISAGGAA